MARPRLPTLRQRAAEAIAVVFVLSTIGLIAVAIQEPFLAPSLGSAVIVQATAPHSRSARAWNTAVGQACGAVAGFLGVYVAGATSAPMFFGSHTLDFTRVVAMVMSVFITILLQQVTRSISPAGGATGLVIAVGEEPANWIGVGHLVGGIVLVTLLGEVARRFVVRVIRPIPIAASHHSPP